MGSRTKKRLTFTVAVEKDIFIAMGPKEVMIIRDLQMIVLGYTVPPS